MPVRAWLARAGRFDVEVIHCPDAFVEPINLGAPRAGVLHTIEGSFDAGLGVFRRHYAPHFVVGAGRIAQLLPVGVIGLALVQHNDLALIQVEVEGFSLEKPWMFPDSVAEPLAALMRACADVYGVPLTRPWPDGVYGRASARDPHRAEGKFGRAAGWFGHGDVPSPDSHWDPGNLKWSELFRRAAELPTEPVGSASYGMERPCPLQASPSNDA